MSNQTNDKNNTNSKLYDISQLDDIFSDDYVFNEDEINMNIDPNFLKYLKDSGKEDSLIQNKLIKKEDALNNPIIVNNNIKDINNYSFCQDIQNLHFLHEFDKYTAQTKCQNFTLDQFIEFLNYKINGDKMKKITKEVLKFTYNLFRTYLSFANLTRAEKRNKILIFQKMFTASNIIMFCLDKCPTLFLNPILIFNETKRNQTYVKTMK